jgi:hypothetical protein
MVGLVNWFYFKVNLVILNHRKAIQLAKWLRKFIFGLAFISKDTSIRTIKYISSFNVFWLVYSRVSFLQSHDSNLFKI